MKKLLLVLVTLLMALCLVGCGAKEEAAKTEEKKTLYMATEATFQPYEYYEGEEIVGIDVEIAKAICDKLDYNLEVTDVAFDSIIPGIMEGKYDFGLAGMTVTDERKEQVNFSDSYATGVQVVIVNEDSAITSVDDLFGDKNYTVGTQTGTTGFLYATWDIADAGLGTVKDYMKTTDAAQALVNKQIDCILLDNEPAKAIVANNEGLKILDTAYAEEAYAIAIAKENTELLDAMNSALNELIKDGTVDTILKKYIGD